MSGARILLEHVNRAHGAAQILHDVSFGVEPGELVALTGPSGSGKTTLLQLIGSLDTPTSGSIYVDDIPVHTLKHPAKFRRDVVGFVFQLHHLLPSLTVQENVELTMVAARVSRRERHARAQELLDEVGLGGRSRALPSDLSGGERQRVAVARALAGRPRLILADEPTGSLDSVASARIWALLAGLRERHGTTILVASHDPSLLEQSDRGIAIADGRVSVPANSGQLDREEVA
ncbi:MAG TPA: ABC transporter ATP-binding protein [Solirubrobacteraceae bacterium]|nr:ABC transporter ATP-binding protein [Solirubrobacteraceae bacterium]